MTGVTTLTTPGAAISAAYTELARELTALATVIGSGTTTDAPGVDLESPRVVVIPGTARPIAGVVGAFATTLAVQLATVIALLLAFNVSYRLAPPERPSLAGPSESIPPLHSRMPQP